MAGNKIDCDGVCSRCPYPEIPAECENAPITHEEYLELREIERTLLFPKTRKQIQRAACLRRYYESHKEQVLARCKKWRSENREHVIARNKRYYQEHRDEYAARWRKRYQLHREEILAQRKLWRESNPTYFRDYYQRNKGRINSRFDQNRKKYGPKQAVIREARQARGWTQKDLAERMGMSYRTIACWEQGRNPANWEKLYQAMPELERRCNIEAD